MQRVFLFLSLFAVSACAHSAPATSSDANADCNQPVLMVVNGTIEDQEAASQYAAGLRSITAYPDQHGFYYALAPKETFEGDWSDDRLFVVAKFPCIEAARGFWQSEAYQSVRPLRTGMGPLTVTVHEVRPEPSSWPSPHPEVLIEEALTAQSNPY